MVTNLKEPISVDFMVGAIFGGLMNIVNDTRPL